MRLADLDIWAGETPEQWVRDAMDRWAALILRASRLQMALFDGSPLPRTATEALAVLYFEDGACAEPAVIARRLRLTRPSVTAMLDRLETGGYAERRPHPADRRRKVVRLTRRGVEVIRAMARGLLHRDAAICATFDRRRVTDALDMLGLLCDRIEAWDAARPAAPRAAPAPEARP